MKALGGALCKGNGVHDNKKILKLKGIASCR
jgi:hypothetical protein